MADHHHCQCHLHTMPLTQTAAEYAFDKSPHGLAFRGVPPATLKERLSSVAARLRGRIQAAIATTLLPPLGDTDIVGAGTMPVPPSSAPEALALVLLHAAAALPLLEREAAVGTSVWGPPQHSPTAGPAGPANNAPDSGIADEVNATMRPSPPPPPPPPSLSSPPADVFSAALPALITWLGLPPQHLHRLLAQGNDTGNTDTPAGTCCGVSRAVVGQLLYLRALWLHYVMRTSAPTVALLLGEVPAAVVAAKRSPPPSVLVVALATTQPSLRATPTTEGIRDDTTAITSAGGGPVDGWAQRARVAAGGILADFLALYLSGSGAEASCGYGALHYAARGGSVPLTTLLTNHAAANIFATTPYLCQTPAHRAAAQGHLAVVSVLAERARWASDILASENPSLPSPVSLACCPDHACSPAVSPTIDLLALFESLPDHDGRCVAALQSL